MLAEKRRHCPRVFSQSFSLPFLVSEIQVLELDFAGAICKKASVVAQNSMSENWRIDVASESNEL